MEGISAVIIYTAIAAGFGLVFWLIFKFRKYGDIVLEIIEPAVTLGSSIAKILIKDPKKEEEASKYFDILSATVNRVNHMKEDIKKEIDKDMKPSERHKLYREKAMLLANKIAQENGINPDVMSKTVAETAIDMILDKLPKAENEDNISN